MLQELRVLLYGYLHSHRAFSFAILMYRQLLKNYRAKSVEGLSFVFLLQWTLGDLTNFLGCILTKQLFFQIVIACYMLFVDLCLCAQYWRTY